MKKGRVTDREVLRRDLLKLLGATTASLALMEATGMPAFADAVFTIGSAGGSWRDGIKAEFIEKPGLEAQTGVKTSYFDGPSAVVAARVLAQPDNPPCSVADLLDGESALLADAGVLRDYDLGLVTNYPDIHQSARSAPRNGLTDWHASMTLPTISIAWNTKEATKPTKWQDLWDPKYKGKVGIPQFAWYGLTLLHAINKDLGGTEDDVSKGVAAIADLVKKNEAVILPNQEQVVQALGTGQISIMPYWNGRTFGLMSSGVPLEFAYVPGMIQLHNGFSIMKNTQFFEHANRFINNTLNPEFQVQFAQRFRYPPANTKAALPASIAHYKIPEWALEQVVQLDWKKVNASRSAALEQWNRAIYT